MSAPQLTTLRMQHLRWVAQLFDETDERLWLTPSNEKLCSDDATADFLRARYVDCFSATLVEIEHEINIRPSRDFKSEHDLTDDEFASDHWQTLFAIQYPEARP